ncbi:MAG: hypothetical protein ACUVXG_09730 [Anaerolineae bacterium]
MFAQTARLLRVALAACLLLALAGATAPVAGGGPPHDRPPWLSRLQLPETATLSLQEPVRIAVQGLLTNPLNGEPLPDGPYTLHLALYRQAVGGVAFWEETQPVNLEDGLFDLLLGNVRGDLTPDLFYEPVYLGITVVGDSEMTPRQPLLPVPEALVARTLRPGAYWAAETGDPVLSLENRGGGVGIYIVSAVGSAVVGQSSVTNTVGVSGLSTHGDGVGGFSNLGQGGYFASVASHGATGTSMAAGTAGLRGTSHAGVGVQGFSEMGAGGYFSSTHAAGLYATASNAMQPAVRGEHSGGGPGLAGQSLTGPGVEGQSSTGYGVSGSSETGAGGFFRSVGAPGLRALTTSPQPAVEAMNLETGPGLWGESLGGNGVYGTGLSPGTYGGFFVGHGGVRAQAMGGPALLAEGPIASTAPTHLWIGGIAFHPEGEEEVTVIPQPGGGITLTASAPTTVHLYATFSVPAVLYGQPISVHGLRVQYRTTDPGSYVDATSLARGDGAGGSLFLVDDTVDRAATGPGSFYEPPLLGLGHEHLSADNGALGLHLTVHLGGEGKALALYGARLTLATYPQED